MKERSYNVRDEEDNADHEMKKCLDRNGEQDAEKKTSGPDGEPKSAGRLAGLSDRAKGLRSKKSTLIIVLLCVLLLVFFIIIIALAVRVGRLERRTQTPVCDTAECLESSSRIVKAWNTTIDPCQDFWSFSCGKWMSKNPLPKNRGSLGVGDTVRVKINSRLRHLLDLVPHDASVRDPEWKAQRFYQSCMNVEAVEQTLISFKNILNEIGGWTLLNNWSNQRWDRSTVLQRLHVQYGVTPFFRVTVEPSDLEPTENAIKIFPSGLGLPGPSYYYKDPGNNLEVAYKAFMDDFARELGATVSEASRFAENTFNFERRIAEVTPSFETHRDPFTHYKKLTIRELSTSAPTIPWLELLQQYYPEANIGDMTEVIIFNEEYFKQISTIISTTDNVGMHNYLMWQFSFLYAPHLSTNVRQIANRFQQSLEGVKDVNLKKEDRWEYCLRITSEYLGHALGAMYVKHYFVPDSSKEAYLIEKHIQESFTSSLNSIPWAQDYTTKEYIKEKMSSLLSLRGYPDFISNTEALSKYYIELNVQGDFLQNVISGKYFFHKKQQAHLKSQATAEESWTIFPQDIQAIYKYFENHMVVPAGLLQEPLFVHDSPLSVRFGSLGTHIGSQMFKALDDKGVMYQKLGLLDPWLTGQSASQYHKRSECLKNKMMDTHNDFDNYNLTVGEFIADLAAVKFSYQAFREMERENDLPGIGRSHEQVFFISYVQSMCEHVKPEKVEIWSDVSMTSPKKRRVINTLKELPEFSEAFGCPSGTPMSSGGRCTFW